MAGASASVELPNAAERVAVLDGVQVLYVGLATDTTDRLRKADVDAAARLIASQLSDDLDLTLDDRNVVFEGALEWIGNRHQSASRV